MDCEWDPAKTTLNLRKHGVSFADAVSALEDATATTIRDPDSVREERWIALGMRRPVAVDFGAESDVARTPAVHRGHMRKQYDFSKGKRGPVVRVPPGKTRITIRLDDDIVGWFRTQAEKAGGGNYQTLINDALRRFVEGASESLESTLRRVIREELRRAS